MIHRMKEGVGLVCAGIAVGDAGHSRAAQPSQAGAMAIASAPSIQETMATEGPAARAAMIAMTRELRGTCVPEREWIIRPMGSARMHFGVQRRGAGLVDQCSGGPNRPSSRATLTAQFRLRVKARSRRTDWRTRGRRCSRRGARGRPLWCDHYVSAVLPGERTRDDRIESRPARGAELVRASRRTRAPARAGTRPALAIFFATAASTAGVRRETRRPTPYTRQRNRAAVLRPAREYNTRPGPRRGPVPGII